MKTLNILSDLHTIKGPIISRITRLFFTIKDIIFTYQNLPIFNLFDSLPSHDFRCLSYIKCFWFFNPENFSSDCWGGILMESIRGPLNIYFPSFNFLLNWWYFITADLMLNTMNASRHYMGNVTNIYYSNAIIM